MTSYPAAVVYREVMIPMRDGTRLATDIFFPSQDGKTRAAGSFPVLLTRTPYNKRSPMGQGGAGRAALQGFAVAIQDVRGRYASEGEYRLMQDDSWGALQDGADTIVWLGRQDWSSGRVGTFGVSYGGAIQMLVAPMRLPYLTACFSEQPASDEFTQRSFHNGAFCLQDVERWAVAQAENLIERLPADQREQAVGELREYRELGAQGVELLPLRDVPFLRLLPTLWRAVLDHWDSEAFFDASDTRPRLKDVAVPICHVGGWYDFFTRNTINHFKGSSAETHDIFAAAARANQRLILGPWTHGGMTRGEAGETAFPDAAFDDFGFALAWQDRWLRGAPLPAAFDHRVLLYVMGENRWRAEDTWPLHGTVVTDYYLHAGGALSSQTPAADEAPDSFEYDPSHPLPSCGGNGPGFAGRNDFSQHLSRADLALYTTPPLPEPLEITGQISASIYAASSARDTDWTAKLLELQPDGKAYHVAGGIVRARYRHSRTHPEPLSPGKVESYDIDMWATSTVIRPGNRLQLVISSSDFPVHDRHPNVYADLSRTTERDFVVATQTVHHSRQYPSALHLPLIPAGRERHWVSNPLPFTSSPAARPDPVELPGSQLGAAGH